MSQKDEFSILLGEALDRYNRSETEDPHYYSFTDIINKIKSLLAEINEYTPMYIQPYEDALNNRFEGEDELTVFYPEVYNINSVNLYAVCSELVKALGVLARVHSNSPKEDLIKDKATFN